jgi:hypothetical protein
LDEKKRAPGAFVSVLSSSIIFDQTKAHHTASSDSPHNQVVVRGVITVYAFLALTDDKSGKPKFPALVFCILVGGAEFESATPWMSTKYSNQLN